ncbi:AzlC family ABC transporter permease [Loigolactobacillus iwatensis]|uniref:AzlC family ABC transporter permease n=1 Tax=Loigolactobacillus iwatensis TaxID=1267156 RepID=UPI000F7DDA70|nr:AzlC family ABC transporter permease [Loigolactobacillus iwatensis]
MNSELSVKSGLHDVIPTTFGYIGVGLAFGIVSRTSHLSLLAILLMSLVVYAGSAQFVITSMLLAGSPISAIIFSTFLVNARMILMSTTIAQYFRRYSSLANIGVGSLLTDETFALGMNKLNYTNHQLNLRWFNTTNIVAYLVWAAASITGALIGNLVTDPKKLGLDFALVAMFIGLLYLQLISDRSKKLLTQLIVIIFVVVALYISLIFMSANAALLVATLLGCVFGVVIER